MPPKRSHPQNPNPKAPTPNPPPHLTTLKTNNSSSSRSSKASNRNNQESLKSLVQAKIVTHKLLKKSHQRMFMKQKRGRIAHRTT